MDTVLSVTDLAGGYVLTYSRSFGLQVWYWTLEGSTLPATLSGTTDRSSLDPILLTPPVPLLVASYPIDSITFCCPSVLRKL